MKTRIFVSDDDGTRQRVAFVSIDSTASVLPPDTDWAFVRSADTAEFSLPTAVDDEIRRCGFWVHAFGSGVVRREPTIHPVLEAIFG
jgi:hypothetical protein